MSPLQLGFLLAAFIVPVRLSAIGRRLNSPRFERVTCLSLAAILLAAELGELGLKYFTENTPVVSKLPMQLCDWALLTTAAALLWRNVLCFEVAYFWGLAGTLQGLLTPAIGQDLALYRKVGFFVIHAGIISSILYLVFALRMRPTLRSLARVLLCSEAYFVAAQIVNALTGQNYGFLAHPPPTRSLLDLFPQEHWQYVATINAVALLAFALLYLPWLLLDLRRSRQQG